MVSAGNDNQGFIPNTRETCLALNLPSSPMIRFLNSLINQQIQTIAAQVCFEY
jgi:hypothetical protein